MSSPVIQNLVKVAVDFLPPRIGRSLLDDHDFIERWDLSTIVGVTLGQGGPSFQRDRFYATIREAIRSPGKGISVEDDKQVTWHVTAQNKKEGFSFVLEDEERTIALPDYSGLAEDHDTRMAWFEKAARELNLYDKTFQEWNTRLKGKPLDDDEFAELIGELDLTPAKNYRNLMSSFVRGSVEKTTLVPHNQRYYDRLIGPCGSAATADNYIEIAATTLIDGLREWKAVDGFLHSLSMCSRSSISERIRIDKLDEDQLLRTYEWIATQGDPILQIGAVEVALWSIGEHRALEPFIEQMVERFILDDPGDDRGCFSLLSAMIVLVASEISRKRIMGCTLPFCRKQAAITQASRIVRAIYGSQVDRTSVVEWTKSGGFGHIFFLQGLVDLRIEPRWLPDYVSPDRLRTEFIGRIANAVRHLKEEIHTQSLRNLLKDNDSKLALAVKTEWPFPILPGPLEGEIVSNPPKMPDEVLKEITEGLEAEKLEPNSFAQLVNVALLFGMPASQAGLAAAALRRVKYSIEYAEEEISIFGLIGSLATVAAVTRSVELAEELRVLVRVLRRRRRLNFDPDDEVRIAMVAAASYEGLEDWARFAGEWITELGFEVAEKESARNLLWMVHRLVQIEPALARHCAAANAALASVAR